KFEDLFRPHPRKFGQKRFLAVRRSWRGGWPVFGLPPWKKFSAARSQSSRSPRRMDAAVCRAEGCYPFGREHARHLAERRREFITLLGGAAAWPVAARAQQPGKIPRIGIIDDSLHWNAFRHGLRDLGYLEGQNIAFDYAYGDGVPERLAEAAAALVRR